MVMQRFFVIALSLRYNSPKCIFVYSIHSGEGRQAMTGQELREFREDHHLTQKLLGELLGYHTNYISRLERDDEPITERFVKLLIATLGKPRPKKSL
jgi:hypothetical protein